MSINSSINYNLVGLNQRQFHPSSEHTSCITCRLVGINGQHFLCDPASMDAGGMGNVCIALCFVSSCNATTSPLRAYWLTEKGACFQKIYFLCSLAVLPIPPPPPTLGQYTSFHEFVFWPILQYFDSCGFCS